MNTYDFLTESVEILKESDDSVSRTEIRAVLEDVESPVTNKYIENLYGQVIAKGHIDFDDIPKSKGDITKYSGYGTMQETLITMKKLSETERVKDVNNAVDTIMTAIQNLESLSSLYEKGFTLKNEHVMLEYNTFVFCCVEATTSILSEFVEFVKGFTVDTYQIRLKNTRYRANLFFVDQLSTFNRLNVVGNYRAYLTGMLDKERSNFIGVDTMIGVAAVTATVALAIVPITRNIVYQVYRLRTKLSDALALQAYFLELNKSCVEANSAFDATKKSKVLEKQENVRLLFIRLSDKIKVDTARAGRDALMDKKKDNASLSLGDTRRQVDSSPYDVLL